MSLISILFCSLFGNAFSAGSSSSETLQGRPSTNLIFSQQVWHASEEYHAKYIQGRRLEESCTAVAEVIRNDYFAIGSKVEVYLKQISCLRHGLADLMKLHIDASDPVQVELIKTLRNGQVLVLAGTIASRQKQSEIAEGNALPDGVVAPSAAGNADDSVPVFLPSSLAVQAQAAANTGTAPAVLKALAILVNPCTYSVTVTAAQLQEAVFGSGSDTYASTYAECSRSTASVKGKAIGPIEVCPKSQKDLAATWREVEKVLKASHSVDYNDHDYYILVQPDGWQTSIGSGQLCGSVSWVRENYYAEAAMYLHEVGHNLCLHHSGNADGSNEYTDKSSAMGYCCSRRCYHAIHNWQLGWLPMRDETNLPSDSSSVAMNLVEIADPTSSGTQMDLDTIQGTRRRSTDTKTNYLTFSYRGSKGFDSMLASNYKNQIQIHQYHGLHDQNAAHITMLQATVTEGQTVDIPSTDLKVTYTSTSSGSSTSAKALVCKQSASAAGSACPAVNQNPLPTPDPTPNPAPSPNPIPSPNRSAPPSPDEVVWTAYFTEKEAGSEITSQAMVGLGCSGKYCSQVKTGHSDTIRVDLANAVKKLSVHDVDTLTCDNNMAVSRIKCKQQYCGKIEIECAPVMSGTLVLSGTPQQITVPAIVSAEETGVCAAGSLMTGIQCTGMHCAKKIVECQVFQAGQCAISDTCSARGLTCSKDACGSNCGVCGDSEDCYGGSGRCVQKNIESDWLDQNKDMPTSGLAGSGMKCAERYCGKVQLRMVGVTVGIETQHSPWISENEGERYFWNKVSDDDATKTDCPFGMVVTRIECLGDHCDDLRLECAKPNSWRVDTLGEPYVTPDWFSEEDGGTQDCPAGFVIVGLECQVSKGWLQGCFSGCGDHCDSKKLRCRQLTPSALGSLNTGIANSEDISLAQRPSEDCDPACRIMKLALAGISGASSLHTFPALVTGMIWSVFSGFLS